MYRPHPESDCTCIENHIGSSYKGEMKHTPNNSVVGIFPGHVNHQKNWKNKEPFGLVTIIVIQYLGNNGTVTYKNDHNKLIT